MGLNADQKKGYDLIMEGKSLFLTGKAGTGKTYLIDSVVNQLNKEKKNVIILAFTGIAAMNAKGVTIHSFFHFSLAPYKPGCKNFDIYNLKPNEVELVENLHTIIIDEISMVRCDLLDKMDDALRHYRKSSLPFGGVQMIFVGDLYQLSPIADEEEFEILEDSYGLVDFFKSHAFQVLGPPMYELNRIERQKDPVFTSLLNRLRKGSPTRHDIAALETRYVEQFYSNNDRILLCTHRKTTNKFNNKQLIKLNHSIFSEEPFMAYIEGYFPSKDYPTQKKLYLCKDARVIFVFNDVQKRYVNGTMGRVIFANGAGIKVKSDDGQIIDVQKQTWEKRRYTFNRKTRTVESEVIGTFTQYPLKLAWAITIHKSQGLTFDKVAIDAGQAFADGQIYVALSRCKTFKGILLTSHLSEENIKVNHDVERFLESVPKIPGPPQEEENKDSQWLDYLYYKIYSKEFLSHKFRICLGMDGYYLKVKCKFIKINDYDVNRNMNIGKIYIKWSCQGSNAKEIYHHIGNRDYPICSVEEVDEFLFVYDRINDIHLQPIYINRI